MLGRNATDRLEIAASVGRRDRAVRQAFGNISLGARYVPRSVLPDA